MISPSGLADAILSTVSDAIVAADEDGVVRFWNQGRNASSGTPAPRP